MSSLPRLFRLFSLRHLRRHKLRLALTGVSIALAVSLFVSMRVTEASILASFQKVSQSLAGFARAQVAHGLGIELAALERIEASPGITAAAPLVQETVVAPELGETLMVLGVDYLRDAKLRRYSFHAKVSLNPLTLLLNPNAVILSRSFADRHGLKLGSPLKLETRAGAKAFTVAGIVADEGPMGALGGKMAVMGVGAAQRAFARGDRVDRIEVAGDEAALARLRAALGPEYTVGDVPKWSAFLENALGALQILLFSVTALALLIGLFMVYNSLSLSVVERAKTIGILRAVGTRRRELVAAVMLEAALLGSLAAALGAATGIALARILLERTSHYMNLLMHVADVREISVPADALAGAFAVGVITAVAGAFVPALSAAGVSPMAAIRSAGLGLSRGRKGAWAFGIGAAFLAAGALLPFHPGAGRYTVVVALFFSFSGLALAMPQALVWLSGGAHRAGRRFLGVEAFLALDNVVKFPARTGLTVIAFAGSLSVYVALAANLKGTESAILAWLDRILPFDLSVNVNDMAGGPYGTGALPQSLVAEVAERPGVRSAYGVRAAFLPYRGGMVLAIAVDLEAFQKMRQEKGVAGSPEEARRWKEGLRAGSVLVSGNFARLYSVRDAVELPTASGMDRFPICGTIEDYSWPRGVVYLDREVYKRRWGDDAVTYVDVGLAAGIDRERFRLELARDLKDRHRVFLYDTDQIKRYSAALLKEWFSMAQIQTVLAILIGTIGVMNTLLISVMTQSRQIGLLRAVGASAWQIHRSLALEALYLGLLSGVLGCAMGAFVAAFPIPRLTLLETGYVFPFVWPWAAIGIALAVSAAIALLSSLAPIRVARRVNVLAAIGYE